MPLGTLPDTLVFFEFHSCLWDRLGYVGLLIKAREWDAERLSAACDKDPWLHGLLAVRYERHPFRPMLGKYPSHVLPRPSVCVRLFGKLKDARYVIPSWSTVEMPAPGEKVRCVWWQAPKPWLDVPQLVGRMGPEYVSTFEVNADDRRCKLTLGGCEEVFKGILPGKAKRPVKDHDEEKADE